jgi:hypothetical protein
MKTRPMTRDRGAGNVVDAEFSTEEPSVQGEAVGMTSRRCDSRPHCGLGAVMFSREAHPASRFGALYVFGVESPRQVVPVGAFQIVDRAVLSLNDAGPSFLIE